MIVPHKKNEVKKKVKSQKKAKSTKSDQTTLPQYFKLNKKPTYEPTKQPTMKTVFPANRVEMTKIIHHSPDLFLTPIDATPKPPDKLYDFPGYSTGTDFPSPYEGSNIARDTGTNDWRSPCLAETPIQHKIEKQRNAKGNTTGFVSANDVFNVNTKSDNTTETNVEEDTEMSDIDFDLFMELVQDEWPRGLADAKKRTSVPSNCITAKVLNLDVNSSQCRVSSGIDQSIEHDFDDCIESPDEQDIRLSKNHLDKRNEFFANDIANGHVGINNTDDYKQSRTKQVAAEFQKSIFGAQDSRPSFELPKQAESHQRAPQMHKTGLPFDVSALSYQATYGSSKDDETSPPSKRQKLTPEKVTLNEFEFRPRPSMEANIRRQNNIHDTRGFFEVEPSLGTDGKRTKKSLDELLFENQRKKNENDQKLKHSK